MKDIEIKMGTTVADLLAAQYPALVKKPARGRGNQGDWANSKEESTGELPEHAEHNRAVEAKKLRKRIKQEELKLFRATNFSSLAEEEKARGLLYREER